MKNLLSKLGLVLIIGIIAISGCKKGENDPFLSLKSRDARITGIWKLVDQRIIRTYTSNSVTTVTVERFDGTTWSVEYADTIISRPYSRELNVEKNGTYISIIIDDENKSEIMGNWWWQNDTKNKVQILFVPFNNSIWFGDNHESFIIDRLTDNEMMFEQSSYSKSTSANGDIYENTYSSEMTYEKM
ncbi:MAG: hypothetical protein IIA45_07125 [Bacteroidetes bacterium]|nr:hypothetical protein [Bacteroidota bacterium]